mmetsp:Transcript_21175/g.27883  ORF Transcript_21175/g.27883 Transcript_21175/m.27883 type:complete len:151 (-) Transcript_21175:118-570(-)|eukprot:CAMPEP_0195266108 /NCGR_PEP_ID=MMETSP0706-20130129/11816_1 /TAXON_ID=33640 /ORGANISM="Asterionellopsis glacialis, Strain CCMP134" /LENGTH=150 /DNA_ID=CAMNT_0040320641 /DNA_START=67 /DNA_END=519 /DNA_ORIENTATION=-
MSKYTEVPSHENTQLNSDEVFVEEITPESVVVLSSRTMNRDGNNEEKEEEEDSTLEIPRKRGAGIMCGVLGCLIGGPILAVAAGVGAAYATGKDGATGDIARAAGDVALSVRDKAKEVDEKHDLKTKTKNASLDAYERTKSASKELFRSK